MRDADCLLPLRDEGELWSALTSCQDDDCRAQIAAALSCQEAFDRFAADVANSRSPKACFYAVQLLNLLLSTDQRFKDFLSLKVAAASEALGELVRASMEAADGTKALRICLVFCFNVLKNALRRPDLCEQQFVETLNRLPILGDPLRKYFAVQQRHADVDAADESLEWICYIFNGLSERLESTSVVSLFHRALPESSQRVFLDFLQIAIDETVKSRTVYSLLIDMRAELLDRDADFSSRLAHDAAAFHLSLRKADIVFLLERFGALADSLEADPATKGEQLNGLLRVLICVSFVGGYNKPLQTLLLHKSEDGSDFAFVGKLSDLLVKITKSKRESGAAARVEELSTNVIRMACNLIHANPAAQDFLIDNGFVPFYLSHTNRDELNPHAKEAVIVFVRYLTEANARARELIKQLKVEDFILENASFIKKFDDL